MQDKSRKHLLNSVFESVFVKVDGQTIPSGATPADNSDLIISEEGVLGLLEKLNINKTCARDNLTGRILKLL